MTLLDTYKYLEVSLEVTYVHQMQPNKISTDHLFTCFNLIYLVEMNSIVTFLYSLIKLIQCMINGNYNINNLRGNYLSLYYLIVYVCLHTFSQNNNHRKRSPSQVSLCSLFLLQYHSSTKPCFFLAISILLSANVSVVNIKFCSSPFYFNQIMLILGINLMVFKFSYLPLFGQIQ